MSVPCVHDGEKDSFDSLASVFGNSRCYCPLQANVISPETFHDSEKYLLYFEKKRLVNLILIHIFSQLKFTTGKIKCFQ